MKGRTLCPTKPFTLAMNITDIKKPRGRPVTRWVDNIRNDLLLRCGCGLWALTQQLSNRLDAWHRRKLRYLLGVVYPHHMSNAKVYASTRQGPVSTTCRRRRLLWLGHVVREGRNSASYQALEMAINTRDIKRPRGRPHLRWIDNIKSDLKHANIDISDCFELALDKKEWLMLVEKCAALA